MKEFRGKGGRASCILKTEIFGDEFYAPAVLTPCKGYGTRRIGGFVGPRTGLDLF
jgi:hypothetical protein